MIQRFYAFLVLNDVWILFLCVLGVIWYLIQWANRQQEYRRSSFQLERERAANERNSALLYLLIFVGVIGLIGWVNWQVAPTLPSELLIPPTPTLRPVNPTLEGIGLTPRATPTPRKAFPTPTPIIAPTATLRYPTFDDGSAVPAPNQELLVEAIVEGCTGGVAINDPASGTILSGGISLFGSAESPNFNYYQIDIRGDQTNNDWIPLLDGVVNAPVPNGFLGSANLYNWQTGIYQIKLTVFNNDETMAGSCLIQIGISNDPQ